MLLDIEGVSTTARLGKLATPAHMVVQNLPTCCSNPLGIPGNYAQEARIKDA